MWCHFTAASLAKISASNCVMPNAPELLKVIMSGFFFEYSTSSFRFFQGELALITSIIPPSLRDAMGMNDSGVYLTSLLANGTTTMEPGVVPASARFLVHHQWLTKKLTHFFGEWTQHVVGVTRGEWDHKLYRLAG
ncbi:MAG: hypothetical protein ACJAR7_001146, partial [Polaromonas sp.]